MQEGGVRFVDQPLRFRRDGAEYQAGLARAGEPGEDGEASLGEVDIDVLEVVDVSTANADGIVRISLVHVLPPWCNRSEYSLAPDGRNCIG